jgi:hypothetical protein
VSDDDERANVSEGLAMSNAERRHSVGLAEEHKVLGDDEIVRMLVRESIEVARRFERQQIR